MHTYKYKDYTITARGWYPRAIDPTRFSPITTEQLAGLIALEHSGKISHHQAKEVFKELCDAGMLRWLAEDVVKDKIQLEVINAQRSPAASGGPP
jgi:Asp-tRNA(Asn)/Glu-tRNA(Gln) amidotransferase B subunit